MANTVRGRIIDALWDKNPDHLARRTMNFHSAAAADLATSLAARGWRGESMTNADINNVARQYPAISRSRLAYAAARINAAPPGDARRDAVIREFGFGGSMQGARELVKHYAHFDLAEGVERKRAEHDAHHDRNAATTSRNIADHPVARANQDAAERRATLEHFMGVNDPRPPRTWREAKENVADRLEANVNRGDALRNAEYHHGREVTRKEAIELAYDGSQAMDEATELVNADDVANVYEETQAHPDAGA